MLVLLWMVGILVFMVKMIKAHEVCFLVTVLRLLRLRLLRLKQDRRKQCSCNHRRKLKQCKPKAYRLLRLKHYKLKQCKLKAYRLLKLKHYRLKQCKLKAYRLLRLLRLKLLRLPILMALKVPM